MASADSTGREFTRALLDAMPTPYARLACAAVLAKFGGTAVYLPQASTKADRRTRSARHMLENGMSDADAANTLRVRFVVSLRTAQRDVKRARNLSPTDDASGG